MKWLLALIATFTQLTGTQSASGTTSFSIKENFEKAVRVFEADPYMTVKALFRKGDPRGLGKPALTASVRADGGWFGGADAVPDVPADHDVVTEDDLRIYAEALGRNGFFGPDSWYLNHEANSTYAASADNDGVLSMPVLFLHARYDYVCETISSELAAPMRDCCSDLTEFTLDTGHWMAQEDPCESERCPCFVVTVLCKFLVANIS